MPVLQKGANSQQAGILTPHIQLTVDKYKGSGLTRFEIKLACLSLQTDPQGHL